MCYKSIYVQTLRHFFALHKSVFAIKQGIKLFSSFRTYLEVLQTFNLVYG